MRVPTRFAWSLVAALFPAFVLAAPCSGFTDVDDTHNFCPNVDWLKNRGITFGCTSTTAYCPDAPVTRLQMAASMNRLGTAFTPLVLYESQAATVTLSGTPPGDAFGYVCMTDDVAIFDFRRFATAVSTVTPSFSSMPLHIRSRPVFSADAGSTWQRFDQAVVDRSDTVVSRFESGYSTSTAITRDVAIFQASYRFAIQLIMSLPATVSYQCQLRVSITNRNGGNVPY